EHGGPSVGLRKLVTPDGPHTVAARAVLTEVDGIEEDTGKAARTADHRQSTEAMLDGIVDLRDGLEQRIHAALTGTRCAGRIDAGSRHPAQQQHVSISNRDRRMKCTRLG